MRPGNSVIAYVGSGSIGIAVYDGSKISYFQNISIGALKLHEILHKMRNSSQDFHTVVEEYLNTILNRIAVAEFSLRNLILTGSQIDLVAKLCGAKYAKNVLQFGTNRLS